VKRYLLSRLAQIDLDEIWDYTARTWNIDRAELYVSEIRQALHALVDGHLIGRPANEIGAGYRKLRVNSHFIFYRVESETFLVVRVLHQRMDFRSHISN
jgi:toxin ParE1/3/4